MHGREIRDPLIGTRIDDRYLVHGVLGRGGMGVVYEGVHEQLGRPVAIKVLGAGIAGDPIAVQRFLREARTASQLTHGNIVDVSDLGQLPDGRPYLVMAKMQGMDLCTLLQTQGPQSPQRTAELLQGAAAALDLIHAKGYVHRDIKPENLMHVVREDHSEAVLVLDFGIVGLVSVQTSRLTAEGSVFGTPAYLAPEVIQGEQPDGRADTYALATVAFELITGVTPFFAQNPLQILPRKVLEEAPSMSKATGIAFSEALEAVLAKGLARDPKNRYSSTGAFVEALEAAAVDFVAPTTPWIAPARAGLDDAARERLRNTATSDMEMPIGASAAPSRTKDTALLAGAYDGYVTNDMDARSVSTETARMAVVRRRRLIGASVSVSVAIALGLWLMRTPQTASPDQPEPAASPAAPAVFQPSAPPPAAAQPVAAPTSAPATAPAPSVAASPDRVPPPSAAAKHKAAAPKPSTPPPSAATPIATPAPVSAGPTAPELDQAAQRELIQGHLAVAADLYTKATRVDPRNEPAWRGLGLAAERLGRTADAVHALQRAIQLAPDGPNAGMLRARLQKLSGGP